MSFSFFKARSKTPQEVVKAIQECLVALDTKTVVEVRALEKWTKFAGIRVYGFEMRLEWLELQSPYAMEEVEKNFSTMRYMLSGDGETEANTEQVLQLAVEMCKEDVLTLLVHKLPLYGWQARQDLVHCWSILLRQTMDS
ncbi:Calcium-binding protein 39-like protein [Drosera capensis]